MAEKNRAVWETALMAGGHPDYALRNPAEANHALLEAKVGNNAEMKSFQHSSRVLRGSPCLVVKRINGLGGAK